MGFKGWDVLDKRGFLYECELFFFGGIVAVISCLVQDNGVVYGQIFTYLAFKTLA